MFVAVGNGARLVSYDGVNWTTYVSPPIINSGILLDPFGNPVNLTPGVVYGARMFVAFGTSVEDITNFTNYILKSTNGLAWTPIYTSTYGPTPFVFAAAYGNNTWVFIANDEIITASMTSSNWNWTQFQPNFIPDGITFGNGVFVICASYLYYPDNYNLILSSPDGITWQFNSMPIPPDDASFSGIVYGNGVFVATAYDTSLGSEVLASGNLVNWTSSVIQNTNDLPLHFLPVAFGGNQFITACVTNTFTSSDGYTWVTNSLQSANAFAFGQGTFMASTLGCIYRSGVFATNSSPTTLGISTYPGVTINGTAGAVYQIQYSTDLNAWQTLTNFMLPFSSYLWIDTSSPVTGQRFYRSIQLQ